MIALIGGECVPAQTKNYLMVKNIGVIRRAGYYLCTTGDRERLHVAVWKDKWRGRRARWLCNSSLGLGQK